jgi:EmrB/QacA subfamily drug resistance transporter
MAQLTPSTGQNPSSELLPKVPKKTILSLSAIILCLFVSALDQTIVHPAMPKIVEELQGFSLFAWVTTAYLLTSTATIPIAGKLGDLFGRKWVLVSAVFIFVLGSVLSGAAPSIVWLVIFRGLQGIGAGAIQTNAFAMIAEIFPNSAQRSRWQTLVTASFGLATVVGPVIGGYITDHMSWRWAFYVNLPVGAVAITALVIYLPRSTATGRRKIDWWGATTIIGAVVTLLLAVTWGGQTEPKGYAWDSPQILGLLATSLLLAALFIFIESRVAEPILPLPLFKDPTVRLVSIFSFMVGGIMLGVPLFIPLLLQVVHDQTASSSGAIMMPLVLSQVFASIITSQFIARIGLVKVPIICGSLFCILGTGLLATLNVNSSPWQVTLYLVFIGFGIGPLLPGMTIAIQETVVRKNLGVGIAAIQFFRAIGSTVIVAIIGSIVTNGYISSINGAPAIKNLSPTQLEVLQEPQNLLDQKVAGNFPPDVVGAVHLALSGAINFGFFICLGLALLALFISLFLPTIQVLTGRKGKTLVPTGPGVGNLPVTNGPRLQDGLAKVALEEVIVEEKSPLLTINKGAVPEEKPVKS